ncbi:sugar phosphate isomerase/epimerase [Pseudooceanicola sp. HF7]|uniref:sugar phosphate isomerase/epimerase family protein n=1 Tax=Pseudooceanicola sp. HF7 TaxID=2721560 RepID=UPI001431C92C|nr:sugar phosphate isomerase/epimerase [Pseudooceanicola sp. HF7]NIZ10906.1 sugar phosphate isomerase/epimerase [Pseudooceanicola sp. HF7]
MTRTLSLAHLSAIDLPPPALIEAAASAGFDAVGLRLLRVTDDSPGYPLTSAADLRATRSALKATGLKVSDVEFLRLTPDFRLNSLLPVLDTGAELAARTVIAAPYDADLSRLSANLAALSRAAADRGLRVVLEFFPWTPVPDLATCWQVVQAAGPLPGLLVDALHFSRSGSTLDQLAAIPPDRLPFAHLCDAPVQASYTTEELLAAARGERLAPGEGQIDLPGLLRTLPADLPLGLEVPGPLRAGETVTDRLRRIHQAMSTLLNRL